MSSDDDLPPVTEILRAEYPERILVYSVEDSRLWFSGMNANLGPLLRDVARVLEQEGYTVGEPEDDGAEQNGGMFLPVEEVTQNDARPDGGVYLDSIRDTRTRTPEGFEGVGEFDLDDVREFREAFDSRRDEFTDRLPIVVDPERLNTEGASSSPSTFRDREATDEEVREAVESVEYRRARRADSAPIRDLERADRGESRIGRVIRFLRGLL